MCRLAIVADAHVAASRQEGYEMLNELYHSLNPIAFTLGPLQVHWYALAYLAGFVLAGVVAYRVARRWGLDLSAEDVTNVVVGIAWGIIIGARLFYVVFYGDGYYLANPLKVFALGEGGMSFHGGLVGAVVGGAIMCRACHISIATFCDLGVIGAPLGLFFGRCANFVNGELWGAPTDAAWGVVFGGQAGMMPRHPSQLYEAVLEGIVIFLVLFALSRKRPPRAQGTFLGVFLIMYGCFRFAIEFVREPDVQLGYLWGGWLTMGQVLSTPLIAVGIGVLLYALIAKKSQQGLPELKQSE